MNAVTPFARLQDIDNRCRENARGLPTDTKVEENWTGIGFKLCGQRLIAKMSEVNEILPPPDTIRVPGVLPWVKGLANIRGTLMPILDMSVYLTGQALSHAIERRVLIINHQDILAGLLVEEVYGLRRFKPEMKVNETMSVTGELDPYLDGFFSDEQAQWHIFSMDRLVETEKFLKVV